LIRSDGDKKLWIKISLKPLLRRKIEKQAKVIHLCINSTNDHGHEKEKYLLQYDYNDLTCKPPMNLYVWNWVGTVLYTIFSNHIVLRNLKMPTACSDCDNIHPSYISTVR